jgi:preprotein translocase subunit YajC
MISQHMHQLAMLSQELIATNGLPSMSGSSGVVSTPTGVAGEAVAEEGAMGGLGFEPMLLLLVVFGGIILFSMFGGRKEKKKRAAMMNALTKNDRIQTIGGIIGSVVEVKPDTVVVQVDSGSNIRMTFSRAAVQQVLEKQEADSGE